MVFIVHIVLFSVKLPSRNSQLSQNEWIFVQMMLSKPRSVLTIPITVLFPRYITIVSSGPGTQIWSLAEQQSVSTAVQSQSLFFIVNKIYHQYNMWLLLPCAPCVSMSFSFRLHIIKTIYIRISLYQK